MAEWVENELPTEDGLYAVAIGYSRIRTAQMHYTVEGGWNTSRDSDGVLDIENAIDNDDGYIKAWFRIPPYEGATC